MPNTMLMPKVKGSKLAVGTLPDLDPLPDPELDEAVEDAKAAEPSENVGVLGLLPLTTADVAAPPAGAGTPVIAVVGATAVATELTPGRPVPEGMALILDDVALKTVWPIAISLFSKS